MPASPAKLISKANAATILFLNTELDTGLSFIRMTARIRSHKKPRRGDAAKIERYMGYAHLAYDTALSRLGTARPTAEQMREINLKLSELRQMLGLDQN